ncbi:DUF2357 domain-containing protein [Thermosporothrix hazakensis]|jgi:hypothetical protein|nr:DUF2357 domain-containing protein [Thermosporothrix hazakensis]
MMATPISGVNRWLTINQKPLRFHPEDENEGLAIREFSTNYIRLTNEAPAQVTIVIDGEELQTARYGIWQWKPGGYAGLYRIEVLSPGLPTKTALVRVFPHKLTQHHYEQMQDELSKLALDLLYSLDSPAIERTTLAQKRYEPSPLQEYYIIQQIVKRMCQVIADIRRDPHYTLHTQQIRLQLHEITYFSHDIHPVPGEHIVFPQSPYPILPSYWSGEQSYHTYDTYENRLLKHFLLKQLSPRLDHIQESAQKELLRVESRYKYYHNPEDKRKKQKLQQAIAECQRMKLQCVHWASEPFLRTVSSFTGINKATQMLLKHPLYNRFYQLYLKFQTHLKKTYSTDKYVTEISLRKVSELYEMWSIFTATRILVDELKQAGYHMISNATFYEVETDYFEFDVRKNTPAIIMTDGTYTVQFIYEPVYPNKAVVHHRSALAVDAPNVPNKGHRTPDFAVEVYQNDIPHSVLIFDAKYRYEKQGRGQFAPKSEDLERMSHYKDVIIYRKYTGGTGTKAYKDYDIVTSACILYPGNHLYIGRKYIGALPFFVGMSPQRIQAVRQALHDLLALADLIQ